MGDNAKITYVTGPESDPIERTGDGKLIAPNWYYKGDGVVTEGIEQTLCEMRGHAHDPRHSHSIELTPIPLYRAEYECRHCLERFEDGHVIEQRHIKLNIETNIAIHHCTPEIIGIAELMCFKRQ